MSAAKLDPVPSHSIYSYALLQAVAHADALATAECLANGASLSATDPDGRTALIIACEQTGPDTVSVVNLLLARGADLTLRDNRGRGPQHAAAAVGNLAALRLLCAAGALVDAKDAEMNTPLHLARGPHCADFLLAAGARCFVENRSGHTPLMEAVLRNDPECVDVHLKYGARPLTPNKAGVTAVSLAWECGLAAVLETLHRYCSGEGSNAAAEDLDSWLARVSGMARGPQLGKPPRPFLPTPSCEQCAFRVRAESPEISEGELRRPYYDITALERALSSDVDAERQKHLRRMQANGLLRVLRGVPDTLSLDGLLQDFPNFREAIQFLEQQISLCRLAPGKAVELPPTLLLGDPGVGKTRFVREVADLLGLEFSLISCGGVSASFVLAGSSTSWKNGKPGRIHSTLRDGETLNPIIALDEIDKLSGSLAFDAYGPLHQLLEKRTASAFEDECVEVPMDCSAILWFATANDLSGIPSSIVSRLNVISVRSPSGPEIPQVARSVYRDILADHAHSWGPRFGADLSPGVIDCLLDKTPREIRKILLSACGIAAMRSCEATADGDAAPGVLQVQRDDILAVAPCCGVDRGIGFLR